jgi:triacylglycerol lipase
MKRRAFASLNVFGFFCSVATNACTMQANREGRCSDLKTKLNECIGTPAARLDCGALTDADIERAASLTEGNACALLASAAPLDGDLNSSLCRLSGVGCVASRTPRPVRKPARYPLVLVNGIDTSPLFRYSGRIAEVMQSLGGHTVRLAVLSPYQVSRVRAQELAVRIAQVRAETGAAKVNLICHSFGGLDCRYLVSPSGLSLDLGPAQENLAQQVASITTVGTPHRGTRVADQLLGFFAGGTWGKAQNDFATWVGDWFSERTAGDSQVEAALRQIAEQQAPTFNAEISDAQGVYYQSFAGFSRTMGETNAEHERKLHEVCKTTEGADGVAGFGSHDYTALTLAPLAAVAGGASAEPNDGLVTVASARWGNFRGCIAGDHQEQLGQRNLPNVNVRSGLDIAWFYANVASDLAERGL